MYEGTVDFGVSSFRDGSERTLSLRWIKRSSHALGMAKQTRASSTGEGLGPAKRMLLPFDDINGHAGVFITGASPHWLLKEDYSTVRLFECALGPVYGFTTVDDHCVISLGEVSLLRWAKRKVVLTFPLLLSSQDVIYAHLPENTHLHREQPFTKVIEDRVYTGLVYVEVMHCYAALAAFEALFEIFDEEGKPIHSYDGEQALEPTGSRSALEIIEPGSWKIVDGYGPMAWSQEDMIPC